MNLNKAAKVVLFLSPMAIIIGIALLRGRPHYTSLSQVPHHYDHPPPGLVVRSHLLDKWAAQKFTDLNTTNPGSIAGQINLVATNVSLGDAERESLDSSVAACIAYFNSGTFEDYAKFRFVTTNCSLSPEMSEFCRISLAASSEEISSNPQGVLEKYWQTTIKNNLAGFWIGLSLDNSRIQVEDDTAFDDRMPSQSHDSLNKMLKELPNVGILLMAGGAVRYHPTPSEVVATYKRIKVANVTLLPKTGDNDVIYPVYLTLYWSPEDRKWLPFQIVGGYTGVPRKRTLWF